MILHQQLHHPESAPLEPWLAVHCESLTLADCEFRENKYRVTAINHESTDFMISNVQRGNLVAFAAMIEKDIYQHLGIKGSSYPLPTDHSALGTLPSYILLNSLDGTTPAILHTQDPVALYFAQDPRGTLGNAEYFRSSRDLTAEGWAYWWEDAQRAFHKLTIEHLQATGTPVPPAIAAAVKHD